MKTSFPHRTNSRSDALRILVVDDNDTNRLVFRLLMEPRGHEIVEAHSGQMALDTLSTEDIDLVFLDLNMPQMDGFETAQRYRNSTRHLRPIPIIALTAQATQENRNRCLETGMNGLIAKPLNLTSVDSVVKLVRSEGKAYDLRPL
jgi:CheY-like chemotaxis protein